MAFIVLANFYRPGGSQVTITKPTRRDALETAVGLRSEGMAGVVIIGDGRTYVAQEFAETVGNEDF